MGIQRVEAVRYGVDDLDEAARYFADIGLEPTDGTGDVRTLKTLENQIVEENVARINRKVRIIAEGANGPTTTEADRVLRESEVLVIPDFLANAGGVTCSYFEQVQSNMNYYWAKDEVLGKLDVKMTAAYHAVSEMARKRKLYMRDAAYIIAVDRVARACHDRGWV